MGDLFQILIPNFCEGTDYDPTELRTGDLSNLSQKKRLDSISNTTESTLDVTRRSIWRRRLFKECRPDRQVAPHMIAGGNPFRGSSPTEVQVSGPFNCIVYGYKITAKGDDDLGGVAVVVFDHKNFMSKAYYRCCRENVLHSGRNIAAAGETTNTGI